MKIVTLFLVLIVLVAVYEVNCVTRHRHKPEKKALQKPSVTRHRLAKTDQGPQVEVTEVPSNQPAAGSTGPSDPTGAAPALGSAAPASGSTAPPLGSGPTDSTLPVGDNSTNTSLPAGSGAGGAWRSLLKPETNQSPEEKKKDAQLCAKRGGVANMIKQNLTAGYRDLSMTLKTFSVGFSAYLFKNYFNVFFKDSFISDFQALKQGFFTAPTLSAEALRDKLPDFHWDMSDDPLSTAKLVLKQHDINENGSLNFKEFSWYAIKETSPYNKDFKCQSCLENIRKELHEFFEFVDCNSNGSISSEELYRALNKLQAKKAADSRETNDFVLKADPRKKGFLKKVDFLQAIMKGLWEQLITDDGVGSI